MSTSSSPTIFIQNQFAVLDSDLTLTDGTVLPAGTKVLSLPATTAACLLVESESKSLAEAWASISRVGHFHADDQANLSDYNTQLIRYANRLAAVEAWAATKGYTLPPELAPAQDTQ